MRSKQVIIDAIPNVFKKIDVPNLGKKYSGKVRDFYFVGDPPSHKASEGHSQRVLITTDRQSAFDVILGHIPFKGAVLNLLAAFWFEKTKHIVKNHIVSVPDPNVSISYNCTPIPVEMIVRGYLSGVTKTSVWYSYSKGEREIYGITFPDGLEKNDPLPRPVITPTTHPEAGSALHDERLTRQEIIEKKIVSKELYAQMEKAALALFEFGSTWCKKHGLILVDTKYEFGLHNGKLMLIDEIHTPDSSRFWIAKTYKERVKKGLEPENFDKEFLRLWYADHGYRGDGTPPPMPQSLVVALAQRYMAVYEKITGKRFPQFSYPIEKRIIQNIKKSIK